MEALESAPGVLGGETPVDAGPRRVPLGNADVEDPLVKPPSSALRRRRQGCQSGRMPVHSTGPMSRIMTEVRS